ncbi:MULTISPECIES: heavy-metal-associated domain-containing protein [Rhodobacterales]|jgi:Copper chaperone|uniref:Heavy metal transport/detoxification protein n=2 Tax=Rhodobacterales TaxID=204455 RepID=C8S1W2_9RHOB|nr:MULTISPECIES: heavy-metal-associated domain-containing protein [Paracoccaceae]AMY72260.1 heavy metal transport/detoxification protein [Frigidibacter mobilis]EEW25060.1 heavy metal transport/detoxification protein [Rhodobacter sp. SW2]MDO9641120.1 heavy-metal-associated domain-containing protein [Pseudotabrizicola sp.]
MQFHIETMTCGGCARGVTKAIQSVDATATVQADPPNRRVEVTTTAPRDQIVAALTEAGFAPA